MVMVGLFLSRGQQLATTISSTKLPPLEYRQAREKAPLHARSVERGSLVIGGDSISFVGGMLLVPRCAIVAVPPSSTSPIDVD